MKIRRAIDVVFTTVLVDVGLTLADEIKRAPGGAARAGSSAGGSGREVSHADGRGADRPSQISGGGWWQVLKRVFQGISADRILAEAAGVTFYSLLAIFPAIAALISLYGLIADPSTIGSHLSAIGSVVPSGGMQIISEQVHNLTSSGQKALGLGAIIGLLTSIWSANAGIKSMFDALNVVYKEKESRSFVHLTWLSLGFTLSGLVLVILALGAIVVVPAVLNFIGFGSALGLLLKLGRWPVLLAAITFALAMIYRFGPSRVKARWRWLSWGSGFAAIAWLLASALFSWYVASFGSYNKTYGSLGAAIGFMTWIWISMTIVLIGGELNSELEHQTERDTTVGPNKKMGSRGATMADEVAKN